MKFSKEILVITLVIAAIVLFAFIQSPYSYKARAKATTAQAIDKASELANRTKDAATEAKDKASDLAQRAKNKTAQAYGNAKATVRDAYDNVKDSLSTDKKVVVTTERSVEVQ